MDMFQFQFTVANICLNSKLLFSCFGWVGRHVDEGELRTTPSIEFYLSMQYLP